MFHDDEHAEVVIADLEHLADKRVIERGCSQRLATKPLACRRVVGQMRRQNLDRDVAPEARVVRTVDLAHPTDPDPGGDLIRAEARTSGQAHPVRARL